MCKPGGLQRHSGQEKSRIDAHFFDEEHLLNLENHDISKEADAEDVELDGIRVATYEDKNVLWVALQEHRLQVLCQHYNTQVLGHWGRDQTQELASSHYT